MQCSDEISIFGYIGGEIKTPIENKNNFVTFSVAVQKKYKGEKNTTWYKCFTNNEKVAEIIKKYFTNGSKVYIRGIPKIESYLDNNNQHQVKIAINITSMNLLLSKKNSSFDTNSDIEDNNLDINDEIPF